MSSATDIANFLACRHLLTLEQAKTAGTIKQPYEPDPNVELLKELGNRHEQDFLRRLKDQGMLITEISTAAPWEKAATRTVEAIRSGVDVVYQASFQDGDWRGRSDFLMKVDQPSALGSFSYEVVETKLARSAKARAILQLCFYSELLAKIQGIEPTWMKVVLKGGIEEPFLLAQYIAYFRKVKRDFLEASRMGETTYPEPVELCDVCDWFQVCDQRRRADDHLSFVAGINRNQRRVLVSLGVQRLAELGSLPLEPGIKGLSQQSFTRIREQARLQVEGREKGKLIHKLLGPVKDGEGLASLPAPSPGDLFLDFESVPYAFDIGLEYLTGFVAVNDDLGGQPGYRSRWSLDPKAEKAAFEEFITWVLDRLKDYPGLHIYHYAPAEPTAIKQLAGRHAVCIDQVDELLRAEVFIDLYRVVRQALRASVESYSIKKLEPLYGFVRTAPLREANLALQTLETILTLGDGAEIPEEILATVEAYNRDDCFSALRLRDWLEEQRHTLELSSGQPLPRPVPKSGEPSEALSEQLRRTRGVEARLLTGLPEDRSAWTKAESGRWLLAQFLEWHRREQKSVWWEYYRLLELSAEELIEDRNALGGLTYLGPVGREKKSLIHRYAFPAQDHPFKAGDTGWNPATGGTAGEIVQLDEAKGIIDLKRGALSQVPQPTALIPKDIVGAEAQEESLLRSGDWVAENGLEGPGPFQAARDLLLGRPPQLPVGGLNSPCDENGNLTSAARNLVLSLAEQPTVLPVQGPPGAGKTFVGARMILELIRGGFRVGVTANSHKVISNLLDEVCRVAEKSSVPLRTVQNIKAKDGCYHPTVSLVKSNAQVLKLLRNGEAQIGAGTAWLWAAEEMIESIDVLFVDEAAQISLANVLAVSPAAKSLVLLGDPQQLEQPQKGVHPPGADGTAFSHLLLPDHETITSKQGLFLAETYRLHPDICAFTSEAFYEDKLVARPENQRQRINVLGPLNGTGLRFVPVEHRGNQNESPEEVERIAALIEGLLEGGPTWTDKAGATRPLTLKDILIVAPYNAQVARLRARLPAGPRVGTVDKFQGQEAPLVFYSMATSTPEDAPRGMEFLYSSNRLNVAISRARCVAVLVASPALFDVECKTPRQMMLANAFCRFLESAEVIGKV